MNLKMQNLKRIVFLLFISSTLIACSTEKKSPNVPEISVKPEIQKPSNDSAVEVSPDNDPPMIDNPDEIVLPAADYIEDKPEPKPAVLMIPKAKPQLTKQQLFAGALDSHNRVRAKHGLNPLKWSDKLAKYSQEWADHLGKGQSCQMYHRSGSPPYGENLYRSSATIWTDQGKEVRRDKNQVTIRHVVKAWADEEPWYNYKSNSCLPGKQCGHYTQMVWRDTTEVGCAVKFCGDQSQNWVCSYNPPGNVIGKRPY